MYLEGRKKKKHIFGFFWGGPVDYYCSLFPGSDPKGDPAGFAFDHLAKIDHVASPRAAFDTDLLNRGHSGPRSNELEKKNQVDSQ